VGAGGGFAVVLLHVASSPVGAAVTVTVIFLLIFALSFAFGPVPEGGRRFSAEWLRSWLAASLPRMAIAGGFAGLVLVAALSYGNSSTNAAVSCAKGVPPLSGQAVTDDRIANAVLSLNEMVDSANTGDVERARTVWLTSDAHNLTHDIDGPLRKLSEDAARSLCENVIALENVMVGEIVPETVVERATAVAGALQAARPVLRQTGDPTATPVVFEPCSLPIGAVTDEPLTAQRIEDAIERLRQVSDLAAAGDKAGAEAAFAGEAHNITHDIDGPLRTNHEQIAIELCLAVSEIERRLGANYDGEVIADKADESADLLDEGARALGILQ
jgi:hypothetical protein